MSLVSDPDFLIHRIRLSYLRNVEDPYGPRLISLSPTYNLNPYITASSLADVSKWPELAAPISPNLSEDDGDRPTGFPGATSLKHTQTIMSAKSGAVGLRVSGSRRSAAFSRSSRRQTAKNGLLSNSNNTSNNSSNTPSGSTVTPVVSPKTTAEQEDGMDAGITVQVDKPSDSMLSQPPPDDLERPVAPADVPPAVVQFVPQFKAAADMEERRRRRMVLRNPRTVGFLPPQPTANLNPDISFSSSSSSSTGMTGDDSSDEMASGPDDDEFDPDFAATRSPGLNSDSASEVLSLLSGANSVTSTSNSLIPPSALNTRARLRLSPVNESRARRDRKRTVDKPTDLNVDTAAPFAKPDQQHSHVHRKSNGRHRSATHPHPAPVQAPELTFSRCKVQPIRPLKSALTELVLVKRSMLPALGIDVIRVPQKTTDPNASIFKRMSVPEEQVSPLDYTAAYKKFVIYRRMPMMVTRQERTLAIDGGYVHIMPATNKAKAVFDSIKTFSYHISSIADCQQSTKSPSTFKLVVNQDSVMKRYDFEAENPKCASEIVQTLKSLKAAVERSGSGNKSRRSRHVG